MHDSLSAVRTAQRLSTKFGNMWWRPLADVCGTKGTAITKAHYNSYCSQIVDWCMLQQRISRLVGRRIGCRGSSCARMASCYSEPVHAMHLLRMASFRVILPMQSIVFCSDYSRHYGRACRDHLERAASDDRR